MISVQTKEPLFVISYCVFYTDLSSCCIIYQTSPIFSTKTIASKFFSHNRRSAPPPFKIKQEMSFVCEYFHIRSLNIYVRISSFKSYKN